MKESHEKVLRDRVVARNLYPTVTRLRVILNLIL